MYNARRNLLPPLPNTTQSVQEALNSIKYKSSKGEDMLLYNDFNSELVIICCKSNLEILCKSEMLYVNGTFEYCAKHFLQLFSVHGTFIVSKELDQDAEKFHGYYRINPETFTILVNIVEASIKKRDTNFRQAVSVEERLLITLR
ncbi:hypothetical protein QTP88_010066 [Uroleucon formosanum]